MNRKPIPFLTFIVSWFKLKWRIQFNFDQNNSWEDHIPAIYAPKKKTFFQKMKPIFFIISFIVTVFFHYFLSDVAVSYMSNLIPYNKDGVAQPKLRHVKYDFFKVMNHLKNRDNETQRIEYLNQKISHKSDLFSSIYISETKEKIIVTYRDLLNYLLRNKSKGKRENIIHYYEKYGKNGFSKNVAYIEPSKITQDFRRDEFIKWFGSSCLIIFILLSVSNSIERSSPLKFSLEELFTSSLSYPIKNSQFFLFAFFERLYASRTLFSLLFFITFNSIYVISSASIYYQLLASFLSAFLFIIIVASMQLLYQFIAGFFRVPRFYTVLGYGRIIGIIMAWYVFFFSSVDVFLFKIRPFMLLGIGDFMPQTLIFSASQYDSVFRIMGQWALAIVITLLFPLITFIVISKFHKKWFANHFE